MLDGLLQKAAEGIGACLRCGGGRINVEDGMSLDLVGVPFLSGEATGMKEGMAPPRLLGGVMKEFAA